MPDETTLALWMDDELTGDELAAVEAWAATQPDHLAAREETRRYKATLQSVVPASIEPPSPEFFNARIARMIESSQAAPTANTPAHASELPFWRKSRSWFMPMAAAAGMVVAFWLGGNLSTPIPAVADGSPDVYVPETGVEARWVSPSAGQGGVIVLSGVSAIPDSTDFSQTVYLPLPREIDRTAGHGNGDSPVR